MSQVDDGSRWDNLKSNADKLQKDGSECMGDQDSAGMQKCLSTYIGKWDQQLNSEYKELMSDLSGSPKKLLADSEHKWIDFEKAENKLTSHMKDPVFKLSTAEAAKQVRAEELLSYGHGVDINDANPPLKLKEQQDRMNGAYGELVNNLEKSPKAQADVIASQSRWNTFKEAEFKFIDAVCPPQGATAEFNEALKANIVSDRSRDLTLLNAYQIH